ncbi:tellurite resistance protein [Aeromonas phage BUCT695]|uniref:tellurite resistance protein n=1 Tax=Aeromonas phage BUCT695 TaxID=2908630 RepID=UPI0023295B68|nr:tellurite resistance protein [Aeromonas phage BUCT695]UIW10494.1 tellurite resistance protein [Aeromonas phage BUCT695]
MIILKKNETQAVQTEDGKPIMDMSIGCTWSKINRAGKSKAAGLFGKLASMVGASEAVLEDVDLDLSAFCYGESGNLIDRLYFGQKRIFGGAMLHSGDDRGGADEDTEMDNEILRFKGISIPFEVKTVVFVLNSYTHQMLDEIPNVNINFYDGLVTLGAKGDRFAEFNITTDKHFGGAEACVLAKLVRTVKGWTIAPMGEPSTARNLSTLEAEVRSKFL